MTLAQVLAPIAAVAAPNPPAPTSVPSPVTISQLPPRPVPVGASPSLLTETALERSSSLDHAPADALANAPSAPTLALPDHNSLIRVLPRLDLTRPQSVRALPGQLDNVPMFNSNSPEVVQKAGILLSTFPKEGMQEQEAHLDYPLQGRFDVFAHHIAKGLTADDLRTLYLGVLMYNPAERPVKIDVLQGVTYLSQDAPFNNLPSYVANPLGTVFAGPGSRVTNDVLRGERQPQWPSQITIPARSAQMLTNLPIPLRRLTVATDGTLTPGSIIPGLSRTAFTAQVQSPGSLLTPELGLASTRNAALAPIVAATPAPGDSRPLPLNGRSILMRLSSSGPVYLASMSMYAPQTASGDERVPSLSEWITLLRSSGVAGPRDRQPTPPDSRNVPRFFYGRVAGVAKGSQWSGRATDQDSDWLSIPNPGDALSYVISSVDRNTFGTGQIQSAPMLVRYPDTAYRAHGNYGVLYSIELPLKNNTDSTQRVAIMLQTPLQDERLKGEALLFRNPPYDQIFFRGTVQIRYKDDLGIRQTRYMHLVQRRGQQGEPLIRLTMPKGTERQVEVQLIYPPDATPPQVLTVETQAYNGLAAEPQTAPAHSRTPTEILPEPDNSPR
ncbi:MAG: DUF3370 domain-containing protein [Pegethrix bostrychoides GSE-TBD4-15B]|uniref:DUF3370 domain-containing protein n=1 Tax=Pegethrix bostrychoides GSE-TBD4-15B TaxID=2839662 RepID=A0A951P929_9CYAN|nr:DUF3370 domain-containing protein [Pegethrix bostrychoides GSE-TBD4-15B]